MSELDQVIPAEIVQDEFAELITHLAATTAARHILEIGSSSGAGSTRAFVTGIARNPSGPYLHCLEVSLPRFEALAQAYAPYPFVACERASSVDPSEFMTPAQVTQFYQMVPTKLNQYPLEQVLGWLTQDLEYVRSSHAPTDGIERVKRKYQIEFFDIVLIDGSAFTGLAELRHTYGAAHILLDDVVDIKTFQCFALLKDDPAYELVAMNPHLRNGYAYFRRRPEVALNDNLRSTGSFT